MLDFPVLSIVDNFVYKLCGYWSERHAIWPKIDVENINFNSVDKMLINIREK
jgi:hypothetical protein